MKAQCREIEDLEETKQWRHMHQKIKEVVGGSRKVHTAEILDSNGNILFEKDKIAKRWVEFIQGLFADPNRDTIATIENQDGAVIMENEVKHAIESLPTHKAAGGDGKNSRSTENT